MPSLQVLTAQGADTVRGSDVDVEGGGRKRITGAVRLYLNITVAGGTPTVDISIVTSVNGVDHIIGTFAQKTTTGKSNIVIENCPEFIAASTVVAGTSPAITSTLDAEQI